MAICRLLQPDRIHAFRFGGRGHLGKQEEGPQTTRSKPAFIATCGHAWVALDASEREEKQ